MKHCPKCKSKVSTIPTFDGSYLRACENPLCDYEESFGQSYQRKEHIARFAKDKSPYQIEVDESS